MFTLQDFFMAHLTYIWYWELTFAAASLGNIEYEQPMYALLDVVKLEVLPIPHLDNVKKAAHIVKTKTSYQEIFKKSEGLYDKQTMDGLIT